MSAKYKVCTSKKSFVKIEIINEVNGIIQYYKGSGPKQFVNRANCIIYDTEKEAKEAVIKILELENKALQNKIDFNSKKINLFLQEKKKPQHKTNLTSYKE